MKSIRPKNIAPIHSNQPFFQKESSDNFSEKSNKLFFNPTSIQAKLTVNQPNDPYEKEADAMADKVVQGLNDKSFSNTKNNSTPFFNNSYTSIQRQCVTCGQEENLQKKEKEENDEQPKKNSIQRQEESPPATEPPAATEGFPGQQTLSETGQAPTTTEGQTATTSKSDQPAQFIVEDTATPAEGQMRKSSFIQRLNEEVCQAVDQALQGTVFSSDNCPYIRAAFARYQNSTPIQLEQVIQRYEPATRSARSATDLIQIMKVRVSAAATRWAQTGDLSGVPPDIAAQIPQGLKTLSGIAQTVTNISDTISSGIGTVASAIGDAASAIGGLFFKSKSGEANATQSPVSVMQSLGKGNSMDGGSRSKMESTFGTGFSNVEVHTDHNAAGLSDQMNARAFTVGKHVAFGSGQYQPGTLIGDALIAHELAHVVQQNDVDQSELQSKGGTAYTALEEDANVSAAGAVVSTWGGTHGAIKDIGKNALPRLRSGLQLQRCAHASPAKTPGTQPALLSGDWAKDVKTAKDTKNEAMMLVLVKQAVGEKIEIRPAGKSSLEEIITDDYAEAPIVNFDINLQNKKRKKKIIGSNPGYSFSIGSTSVIDGVKRTTWKKYAMLGPNALAETSPLITRMYAEHELFHTLHHLDKEGDDKNDDQELETWTQDFIHYFHQFLSINKNRPTFAPLLDYYSRSSPEAKKNAIAILKAYYDAPPSQDPEKIKDAFSLWVDKWKTREGTGRKGELINELDKFVKPYATKH